MLSVQPNTVSLVGAGGVAFQGDYELDRLPTEELKRGKQELPGLKDTDSVGVLIEEMQGRKITWSWRQRTLTMKGKILFSVRAEF